MCGYDPFYWYEKDLDDEYKERMEADDERTGNPIVGRIDDIVLRNTGNTRQQTA